MTERRIIIAIDGYSSCGKSTLARQLARELGYIFIDSGAMYRAVSLYALRHGAVREQSSVDMDAVRRLLAEIELHFEINPGTGEPEIILNGENVSSEIRQADVSNIVSRISAIREVREKLVAEQRRMGQQGGIVMDGRDIGSVVFPHAELKIFVTADINTRTERRFSELLEKGVQTTREEVRNNLTERDLLDSTREISPLIQAEDAIVLNNSHLTREEQLEKVKSMVMRTLSLA